MVCRIIWVDRVAPRGAEAATGYKKLTIVTTKKTCKKIANRKQLNKENPIKGSHIFKGKTGEQWS